jgi:acyl-CoA thioesterase
MRFSDTLNSIVAHENGYTAVVGEDWSQGRATFGGMVAALGNEVMRRLVPAERQLRGLETIFVGPSLAGTVQLEAQVLRTGKAVTIASARLRSDDKIAATFTGVYGAPRRSAISLSPPWASDVRIEDFLEPPFFDMQPAFVQHFGLRWTPGLHPFAGSTRTSNKTFVRHKDGAALTESHVVALVDCIPSVILQMMNTPAPSSSLTWTVQFLKHDYSFAPDAWWRIDAEANSAAEGYSCESTVLFDPTGAPAALSRQMVAVFG